MPQRIEFLPSRNSSAGGSSDAKRRDLHGVDKEE